jgi:hypothetical protein
MFSGRVPCSPVDSNDLSLGRWGQMGGWVGGWVGGGHYSALHWCVPRTSRGHTTAPCTHRNPTDVSWVIDAGNVPDSFVLSRSLHAHMRVRGV